MVQSYGPRYECFIRFLKVQKDVDTILLIFLNIDNCLW